MKKVIKKYISLSKIKFYGVYFYVLILDMIKAETARGLYLILLMYVYMYNLI